MWGIRWDGRIASSIRPCIRLIRGLGDGIKVREIDVRNGGLVHVRDCDGPRV